MSGEIEKYFVLTVLRGLGKVWRCKICSQRFNRDFIVVGINDAKRHLEAHQMGQVRYEGEEARPKIEKKIRLKQRD